MARQVTSVKAAARDANVVGVRVRGIPLGRKPDAPAVERRDRTGHVVEVFPFGVDEFAEPAGPINLPHRVAVVAKGGGLEHHVLPAVGLDRVEQLVGVFQRAEDGRHRAGHVLAVLEDLDAVLGVAGGVGRHENGLDRVVLDQCFQRRIRLPATAFLGQGVAPVQKQVADGRHRDVGMILETELRAELAGAVADDADANLPIRNGFPGSLRALRRCGAGIAQDFRVRDVGRGAGRAKPSARRNRAERTNADVSQE